MTIGLAMPSLSLSAGTLDYNDDMDLPLNVDVSALDQLHLQAFEDEDVVGRHLQPNERLTIQITTAGQGAENGNASKVLNLLTHFYDGVSEQEVEELDATIKTRANLSRPLP